MTPYEFVIKFKCKVFGPMYAIYIKRTLVVFCLNQNDFV